LITGLVYDCGYSKAHSVPVYEGYALPRGTTTVALAGRELTTCLARMLRDRGVTMETQTEMDIVQDIKEKLCYVVVDYDSERKAYNIGQRNDTTYTVRILFYCSCIDTKTSRNTIYRYLNQSSPTVGPNFPPSLFSSKMPDGQTVAIGSERFRCPEVLFTPSMVGMTTDGVHEVLYKTTMQCAIDIRKSLFQNIVISGKNPTLSNKILCHKL
jgi:actin